MNSFDIIAWHHEGAAFCPDCPPSKGNSHDEPWPVFADSLEEENGATCDACGACLVDGEWLPHYADFCLTCLCRIVSLAENGEDPFPNLDINHARP